MALAVRRAAGFGTSAALHAMILATLVSVSPVALRLGGTRGTEPSIEVVVVAPDDPASATGLKPVDADHADPIAPLKSESTVIALPGFRFNFRKIAARAPLLFPFLTPGLSLDHFSLASRREIHVSLRNPFAQIRDPSATAIGRPLELTDTALQALIDSTWSRRERWEAFKPLAALAEVHSANDGAIPAAIQGYVVQNALQPYVDNGVRDHRLWSQLGVAADHADYIAFISRYVSQHPSTRTSTELLLLLDRLAEASLDDPVTLFDIRPVDDLQWTRQDNPAAFDFIVEIQRHYGVELNRMNMHSANELRRYYDEVRLAILNGIVETTPGQYRTSDARFLIGSILWRRGDQARARDTWRAMQLDTTDAHAVEIAAILDAIQSITGSQFERRIDQILSNVSGRWRSLSQSRLRQFGYRFDTY